MINGRRTLEEGFVVRSPFLEDVRFKIPRFTEADLIDVAIVASQVDIPPFNERRAIVRSIANYTPTDEVLKSTAAMTGIPIQLIREAVEEGKAMACMLAETEYADGRKKVAVAIAPNDPKEYFFFYAHAILAGASSIMKLSAREPVLGRDIGDYLVRQGLPPGMLNLIYADTSSTEESQRIMTLMNAADIPIVMGDSNLTPRQISFCAEHSRALVLDVEAARPHMRRSLEAPLSCLAEHNYVVVGIDNAEPFLDLLAQTYASIEAGNILDSRTRMGKIDSQTLDNLTAMLSIGQMTDTMRMHYPILSGGAVTSRMIEPGAVVEHYSEDSRCGINPLMTSPLPAYITGVRFVRSIDDALRDLELARSAIVNKSGHEKSMALGVYGDISPEVRSRLASLAYKISENRSPGIVDGRVHQGIDLREVLTR